MSIKLNEIKTEFAKYILPKDKWILDVVLHVPIGNALVDGDPIWTMVVAPSSGGKSTILGPLSGIDLVYFLDDLTEKTFLSGYKAGGKEMSLLKMIGSGVLVFSDFTAILSKNPTSAGEILGQLRLVYDGKFIKQTGTGKIEWKGKMGVIAAATPDVYSKLEESRSMGERFGYYCMEQPTDEEIAKKQAEIHISSFSLNAIMAPLFKEYYKSIRDFKEKHGVPNLNLTEDQKLRLRVATMFSVSAKATVHLNPKTQKVDRIPNKAGVGRDNRMSETSLKAYHLMDCYEADDINIPISEDRIQLMEKMNYSSVNRERRKILEILAEAIEPLSASKIGVRRGLGMEKESVEQHITPLHAVGIVQKIVGNPHTWEIRDVQIKEYIKRVSVGIDDYIPQSNDDFEEIKKLVYNQDMNITDNSDYGIFGEDDF